MSSEDAISGLRQNAARTVTDSCKYASRLLSPALLIVPFPIPISIIYQEENHGCVTTMDTTIEGER